MTEQVQISETEITNEITKINCAFDARIDWEVKERPTTNNVVKDVMHKSRELFTRPNTVKVMLEHNIHVDAFLNKHESKSARFNAKALTRVYNFLARNQTSAVALNNCTQAFIANARKLAALGADFTNDLQLATVSAQVKCEKYASKLTRIKTISAGVASTQASITRQALIALGVATKYTIDGNVECLKINLEHPMIASIE